MFSGCSAHRPSRLHLPPAANPPQLSGGRQMKEPYLVAGWFTPNYRHWAERFRQSLIEHVAPYDLIEVERDRRGWEATTRMKPGIVLRFMEKYPDRTLVLSDVDALVTGDLAPLAAIDADVGLRFQCKRLRGRNMFVARAGTIVLKPSARALVEAWARHCARARFGDTDESCLNAAIAECAGIRFQNIPLGSTLGDLIRHDRASRDLPKISHLARAIRWLSGSRKGYRHEGYRTTGGR
jgi:hypothetical protein